MNLSNMTVEELSRIQGAAKEAEVAGNYPDIEIVKGSCRQHTTGKFANKYVVEVVCRGCSAHIQRATSDLWTWRDHRSQLCDACLKGAKAALKALKRAEKAGIDVDSLLKGEAE